MENFQLDVEYNREGPNPSSPKRNSKGQSVYPDLIIHERGKTNNLLIVEFKPCWKSNQDKDAEKLKDYSLKQKYTFAATGLFGHSKLKFDPIPGNSEESTTDCNA